MNATVLIPEQLRKVVGGDHILYLDVKNISDLIEQLLAKYPNIRGRLLTEDGNVNKFINIYVNGEDIRFLENRDTVIKEEDEISIVPAIAGG